MKRIMIILAVTIGAIGPTYAAVMTLTWSDAGPVSTSVACPLIAPFNASPGPPAPVAAGTVMCYVTVLPAAWSGALSLSGPNADLVAIQQGGPTGRQVVVAPGGQPTGGNFTATLSSLP